MRRHDFLTPILTEILVDEIAKALALPQTEGIKNMIAALTGKAIQRFTKLASELDCAVEKEGIAGGARWLLPRFVKAHSARGYVSIHTANDYRKGVFGLTPRVTFGDLVSADAQRTTDRQHMLQTITQSAHNVLKMHMIHV